MSIMSEIEYCRPRRYRTADLSTLVVVQKCVGAQPQKKKKQS